MCFRIQGRSFSSDLLPVSWQTCPCVTYRIDQIHHDPDASMIPAWYWMSMIITASSSSLLPAICNPIEIYRPGCPQQSVVEVLINSNLSRRNCETRGIWAAELGLPATTINMFKRSNCFFLNLSGKAIRTGHLGSRIRKKTDGLQCGSKEHNFRSPWLIRGY